MEKRKVIVGCLFLLSTFLVTPGDAQCDITLRIPHTDIERQRIAVTPEPTDVVCLVCLTPSGGTTVNAFFFVGIITLNPGGSNPDVGMNVNGVLQLIPGRIPDGQNGFSFSCNPGDGGDINDDITLYTTNLIAAVNNDSPVREGARGTMSCFNRSPREVSTGQEWFKQGQSEVFSTNGQLVFDPANRVNATDYFCRLMAMDGRTRYFNFTFVVEFAPEVTFQAEPNMRINETGQITLTCDYQAVPMPTVEWFINDTFFLDPNASRVDVDTNDVRSTLTVIELNRTEGGSYSCNVTNSVGSVTRTLTSVIIMVPPGPVANLTVLDVGETTIELDWAIVFDGYSPITRAVVSYVIEGGDSTELFVVDSTPTTVTLTSLMEFTNYSISVALENSLGRSSVESVMAMTLSRILEAPTVSAVADTSTQLTFTWGPPTPTPTTEDSFDWFVEFRRRGTTSPTTQRTLDADTLTTVFTDGVDGVEIEKGTFYEARVRGRNSRGPGLYSQYVQRETLIDPPSEPLNVMVSAINSFALMVMWQPSSDNGGRPIVRYNITIDVEGMAVSELTMTGDDRSFTIRDTTPELMPNTTYNVTVRAENSAGFTGEPATASGRTQDITEPQTILDPVETGIPTNTSTTLTWTSPGGMVDMYIIRYMPDNGGDVVEVEVNGTETSFNLVDLASGVTYSVVLITVNANGNSEPNPLALFSTLPADRPVVTGPEDTVVVSTSVVLTCTTPDTRPIMWERLNGMPIEPPVYNVEGTMARSTLTITDVRLDNGGVYVCRVGQQTANFTLSVAEATDPPSEGGISTTVIIIAACVGGGGFLLILLLLGIIVLCCCCSRGGGNKSQYSTSKQPKAPRTDKRTKELFEVSTNVSYAPVDSGGPRDTGVSFDMPEDFHAHSSFNTLDKPKNRSSSPDEGRPTSFGAAPPESSNEPRYQDMPPSYDGTVL